MRKHPVSKQKKQIQIANFSIQGTTDFLTANKAVQRLLLLSKADLIHASYKIDGKTITIKPLTTK